FLSAIKQSLMKIQQESKGLAVVVGTPHQEGKLLYNSAAVFIDGVLAGFQHKCLLPTYDVFDERRYFTPGTSCNLWDIGGKKIAITICEDIWQHSGLLQYAVYASDPVLDLEKAKPDLLLN